MLTVVELSDVLAEIGAADTGVTLDVHEVAERQDDLLDLHGQLASRTEAEHLSLAEGCIELLENGDGEGCGLSGT